MTTWREITEKKVESLKESLDTLNGFLSDPNWGKESADEYIDQGYMDIENQYGKWVAQDLMDDFDLAYINSNVCKKCGDIIPDGNPKHLYQGGWICEACFADLPNRGEL